MKVCNLLLLFFFFSSFFFLLAWLGLVWFGFFLFVFCFLAGGRVRLNNVVTDRYNEWEWVINWRIRNMGIPEHWNIGIGPPGYGCQCLALVHEYSTYLFSDALAHEGVAKNSRISNAPCGKVQQTVLRASQTKGVRSPKVLCNRRGGVQTRQNHTKPVKHSRRQ